MKITPFLWIEKGAKEAAEFYVSVFGGESKIKTVQVVPNTPSGDIEIVEFNLHDAAFTIMAAGPHAKFTDALSLSVDCKDQAEVDRYWDMLTANGGEESMCGWLKDKYGVSWQITPTRLNELTSSPDKEIANRAVQAMLTMRKIIIADIEKAALG